VFNVHVPGFINTIWFGLRDTKMTIRERACGALRACLIVVEKRETRYRVQWYYKLFEETVKGLGKGASVESVHGSLMAVGELLGHSGEFMLARYKEVSAHVCMAGCVAAWTNGVPLGLLVVVGQRSLRSDRPPFFPTEPRATKTGRHKARAVRRLSDGRRKPRPSHECSELSYQAFVHTSSLSR